MINKTPYTVWLMGPTSSGKTTIAKNLIKSFKSINYPIMHYDGDEVRDFLGSDFGFNEKNRMRVIEILVYLSNKAKIAGIPTIISALTAHKSAREYISNNITNLYIVYIKCPIKVCEERDPKGLYKKAKNGEIDTLIGYNSEYIPPAEPHLTIETNKVSIEKGTKILKDFLDDF